MLNRLFIAIGVLVILAIGAAFVVPRFIQWGDYRDRMETLASEAFGAPVMITGDIQFTLLPQPKLVFSEVVVGDDAAPALKVGRVEAEFSLIDFIRDQYRVTRLQLTAPEIDIGIGADGAFVSGVALAETTTASNISIANASVADGVVRVTDQRGAHSVEVTGLRGEVTLEALRGPFSFQGSGAYQGAGYSIRLSSGKAGEDGATPVSVFVKAVDGSVTLTSEGSLGFADAPRYAGTLALRLPPPKPAEGVLADAGRGDLVVEGKLDASSERILLSDYVLLPDENRPGTRLSGAAELKLGATPQFNAVVSGAVIALPPRDATAELTDPPYELVRLLAEMPLPAIPGIPGTIGLDVAEVGLRALTLRDLRLDARTDTKSWQIESIGATLPGGAKLALAGNLSVVDGKPIFAGQVKLETQRLDTLATQWRKPAAGNPLFNLPGSLTGDLTLSGDTLTLIGGTLKIGAMTETVSGEIGFAPAGRHLNVEAHLTDLGAEDSAALAALLPDVASDGSFGATFPKGEVNLSADSAVLFGIAGTGLGVLANWEGGVLEVSQLSAADFGGATFDSKFTAFGTLAKPELSGAATLQLNDPKAPALVAAFAALQVRPSVQEALLRQLPADLALRLDAPTGEGGQTLGLSGMLGATNVALDARLSAGIINALNGPLTVALEMTSGNPRLMVAQLGLGEGEIFPEDKPLHLIATLDGAPNNSLETRLTLEGGEDLISFAGNVVAADPERLVGKGIIQATLGDPSAALEVIGAGGVHVPAIEGTATLEFTGNETLSLGEIEGKAGDAPFSGALTLTRRADSASVAGALDFAALDATALLPILAGRAGAMNVGGGVWPDGPIDIGSALRTTSGRVDITAKAVSTGGTPLLSDANFALDWDGKSIRVRGLKGSVGGGTLTLDTAICCAGTLPDKQLTGRVAFTNVALDALLPATVGEMLGGTLTASAQFDGTGGSLATLMGAMTGSGSYTIKDFAVARFDPDAFAAIGGFENVLDMTPEALEVAIADKVGARPFVSPEVTGSFTIAGGVLRSPNLAIDGQGARIFGGGSVRLAGIAIDARYTMTPVAIIEAASGLDAATAEIAADISGPVWAPVVMLDVSSLAGGMKIKASEIELARLEKLRAEDELRQKIAAEERARIAAEQAAAEEAARQKAAEEEAARRAAELAATPPPPMDLGL